MGDAPKQVDAAMEKLVVTLEREEIIRTSMKHRGALVQVKDLEEAIETSCGALRARWHL